MFQSKSLQTRMLIAFAAVAFCLLGVGALSFVTLKDVTFQFDHVARNNFGNSIALQKMSTAVERLRASIYRLGLSATSEEIDETEKFYHRFLTEYQDAEKAYLNIPFVDGEQKLYDAQHEVWEKLLKRNEELFKIRRSWKEASLAKFNSMLVTEYRSAVAQYQKMLQELLDFQVTESNKWINSAEGAASRGNTLTVLIVVAGFVLAWVIGFIFSRSLSVRLKQLSEKLSEGAGTVSTASRQVSSSGMELSSSSSEQAAALQETVASLEEVSAMVAKNAENAKRSSEIAGTSREAAERGQQVVSQMIQSIEEISRSNAEINQEVEASNQEISQMVKVIAEIGEKTKVINDIVFQTKLLSFNASVEAARAGEHGKGFAVVAEEVGNLAQMSGNAARDISQLLVSSIQKVEATVSQTRSKVEHMMQMGRTKVEIGAATAKRCGEVLEEIVRNVVSVGDRVAEIATASDEQAQGVSEINKAMSQMDMVTQQNASSSEQAAAAATELNRQAELLRSVVHALVATVEGASRDQALSASAASQESAHAHVIPFKRPKHGPVESSASSKESGVPRAASAEEVTPLREDKRFNNA